MTDYDDEEVTAVGDPTLTQEERAELERWMALARQRAATRDLPRGEVDANPV